MGNQLFFLTPKTATVFWWNWKRSNPIDWTEQGSFSSSKYLRSFDYLNINTRTVCWKYSSLLDVTGKMKERKKVGFIGFKD